MSKSIRDQVEQSLGFHGRQMDSVLESVVESLQMREAQIEADLLAVAITVGLDEDEVIDTLHNVFSHTDTDTAEGSFDNILASIMSTSRLLSQQTAALADLV